MYVFVTIAILAILLIAAVPVCESQDQWRVSPKPVQTAVFQTSVAPTVNGLPIALGSVRNLPPDAERPRFHGLLASTALLKGTFSTETEIAASDGAGARKDPAPRLRRLGVTASTGLVRYGMQYRTADFYQGPGQEQREAWGEWKNGAMAIRSTVGQRTRLQADAPENRLEQGYNRIDVSWNRPAWPRLGISYVHNAASHTMDVLSLFPQRANHDRVEAAVGYGGAMWDATLVSGYGTETDLLQHAAESRVTTETLTASVHPVDILTITPMLGYRVEQQPWSSARINSPSASISMNYQQSKQLSMTAMGNYFSMRSSDGFVDFDMMGGKGVVTWQLEPVREWKPQLTVEGGYNLQVNRLMPSAQTENISGLLRFVLATM
jgi:hypothetical protein